MESNRSEWFESCGILCTINRIKDVTPPVFNACPANITVNTNTTDCKAVVIWHPFGYGQLRTCSINFQFCTGLCFSGWHNDCQLHGTGRLRQYDPAHVHYHCCEYLLQMRSQKLFVLQIIKDAQQNNAGTNISGTATAEPGAPGYPSTGFCHFKDSLLNIYSYCLNVKNSFRIWRATDPNDPKKLYWNANQLIDLIDKTPPVWNYCPRISPFRPMVNVKKKP